MNLQNSDARFAETRWSLVFSAAATGAVLSREALDGLCRIYWPPLYVFVRRSGFTPHEAEDVVQGFFQSLFSHRSLRHLDEKSGKFRSFLLASLRHYLANEWDRRHAQKRGGHLAFVSVDALPPGEEPTALTPERLFDQKWAVALVNAARQRLARVYAEKSQSSLLERLTPFLNGDAASYEDTARAMQISLPALKSAVHRLRLDLRKAIREEIARTVSSPTEIEGEMHYLFDILSAQP